MAKFLIIGPSGVGKSSVINSIKELRLIEVLDLDSILHGTPFPEYFTKGKEYIESLENSKDILIAVGAGCTFPEFGHKWFTEQLTIVLTGNPKHIFNRSERLQKTYNGNYEHYFSVEFSKAKELLYKSCPYLINTENKCINQVTGSLIEIIKSDTKFKN
ncbi:MAG: hypothetical protein JNK50_05105 [Bacteroidia bacterium]|nr:hypothetical protein [Bacteroidia bacterium]